MAAIFLDIEKTYQKINKSKTFEQPENMGIQGQIIKFIKELIRERWIIVRL